MFPIGALQLGLIVAIAIGCVALWNQIFALRSAGHDIVDYEPRRSVPWGPRDVVMVVVGVVLIVNLCTLPVAWITKHEDEAHDATAAPAESEDDASQPVATDESSVDNTAAPESATAEDGSEKAKTANNFPIIFTGACGTALSLVAAIIWLRLRGADREDLGFDIAHLGRDFRLGVAGFVVASIPVYLIQIAAVQFIPAEHPVSEIFQSHPSALTVLATALVAVVVAPLTEEFFFRVVLQGWLEALFAERDLRMAAPLVIDQAVSSPSDADAGEPGGIRSAEIAPALQPPASAEHATEFVPKPSLMPILLSSFIFALVHLDYGPSAIPLFFFAAVLGYLYRQTHRLWPSVIAHASLNALSTFILVTTPT